MAASAPLLPPLGSSSHWLANLADRLLHLDCQKESKMAEVMFSEPYLRNRRAQ